MHAGGRGGTCGRGGRVQANGGICRGAREWALPRAAMCTAQDDDFWELARKAADDAEEELEVIGLEAYNQRTASTAEAKQQQQHSQHSQHSQQQQ